MKLLVTLVLLFSVTDLEAFPTNIRQGYASCVSCHISPSGGGVLNSYGRATAEEFLSTWHYKRESSFLHGLFREDPPVISIGGDVRYVSYSVTSAETQETVKKNFLMQRDIELAFTIDSKLTFVTSIGLYGEEYDGPEYRRNYILYNFNDYFSFRIGRYFPAFGILFEDHTIATRKNLGWDQGRESYNIEISARNERAEIFVTGIFGNAGATDLTSKQGYKFSSEERGGSWRAAYYIGKRSQLGFSYLYTENNREETRKEIYGPYMMLGFTRWLYLLAEADWLGEGPLTSTTGLPQRKIYSYSTLGVEAFRGMHFQGYHSRKDDVDVFGAKIQFFPRPHFEFTAAYETSDAGEVVTLLAHYYL